MKKIVDSYLNIIYEWNQKLIDDQNKKISKNSKELFDSSSRHLDLIWEATYFDDIDDVFEEWFSKLFDEFIEECRIKAENGEEYELEKKIPVSDIAKNLSLRKLKNYKNFHSFVEILKKSSGFLTISLTDESNCYEPPIDWIGDKIQIYDRRHNLFNEPIDKAGQSYKDYMIQLTRKCKNLSEKYSIIKDNIQSQLDFGHIKLNYKYFNNERTEFKKAALTHEFGHFLDFLIKINAENWDIGRQYRSHKIHSAFNSAKAFDDSERLNYFLDETEFKHLASTYIEHMKILFKRTDKNLNRFLEAAMALFEIDVHYAEGTSLEDLKDYMETISSHFYFNDIKDFFKIIYEDSKTDAENFGVRNRWTILKKWLYRELKSLLS